MIFIVGVSICGPSISIVMRPICIVSFSSDADRGSAIFDFFILLVLLWQLQYKTYELIHYFTYWYNNSCKSDKKYQQKPQW